MTPLQQAQLELACRAMKATGVYEFADYEVLGPGTVRLELCAPRGSLTRAFRPLSDGADAHWLQAALRISVQYGPDWVEATAPGEGRGGHRTLDVPAAANHWAWVRATREVVLQAAAELGAAL